MNWRQHLTAGFIVGIIFFLLSWIFLGWFDISLLTILISILIILIYSLACDLDHPSGKLTWIFIGFSIIVLLLGVFLDNNFYLYFGLGLLVFTFICSQFFGHRKFIHSWSAGIIFCLPLYYFGWEFVLLGFISFLSHLVADKIPFKLV